MCDECDPLQIQLGYNMSWLRLAARAGKASSSVAGHTTAPLLCPEDAGVTVGRGVR